MMGHDPTCPVNLTRHAVTEAAVSTPHRIALIFLMVLNSLVLLGQIWPAGAPPFARGVNIAFLAGSLGYFGARLTRKL